MSQNVLTNARTAGVGKNHTTEVLEGLQLAVSLDRSLDEDVSISMVDSWRRE